MTHFKCSFLEVKCKTVQLDSFHGDVDSTLQLDTSGISVPPTNSPLTSAKEVEL